MGRQGFTLIELIVVLAVAALIMVVAVPMLSNAVPGVALKGTAREIAAGLRQARGEAIVGNRETTFTVDLARRLYWTTGGGARGSIPEEIGVRVRAARRDMHGTSTARFRFFPDGGSTGGRIVLSRGDRSYLVGVDWLTGRVAISN